MPGLVYTKSGYDNLQGEDAICWSAPRFDAKDPEEDQQENNQGLNQGDFAGKVWRNELIPDFVAGR